MLKRYFHADAGHGWLAVKRQELIDLGILNKITSYSYQRGDSVYLEEDCDLTTYIQALKAAGRYDQLLLEHTKHHDRSPIRSYDRFQAV